MLLYPKPNFHQADWGVDLFSKISTVCRRSYLADFPSSTVFYYLGIELLLMQADNTATNQNTRHMDDCKLRPSDAEAFQHLKNANAQYDEYVKLLEFSELLDDSDDSPPLRYSWDNPMGLESRSSNTTTSAGFHA